MKNPIKWLILILICTYTLFSLIYFCFGIVSVPDGIYPGFADLNLLLKYVDCYNNGFNPYIDKNSFCIGELNYPFIWIKLISIFGGNSSHTHVIGFSFILLFVFIISFMFPKVTIKQFTLLCLIMISPPFLLLLERGNVDIIIFILIVIAVYYIRNFDKNYSIYLTYIVILFASILKIFPFFLVPLVLIEKISIKKKIIILFSSLVIFSIFVLLSFDEIKLILANTPRPSELAFGKNVLIQEIVSKNHLLYISIVPFIILTMFFYIKREWVLYVYTEISKQNEKSFMFTSGLLIFLGIYFFGNNWDYRLVYIVLFLPIIFKLSNSDFKLLLFKRYMLISITIILLVSALHRSLHIYQNYIQWFIFRNLLMSLKYILLTSIVSFGTIYLFFILKENFYEMLNTFKKKQ
jgi:hypothetical protein